MSAVADWAVRYIQQYRLALVPIPPGHKAPLHPGWNQRGGYATDAGEARQKWSELPDHGIGAVLGPSGLSSIDVDSPGHAEPVLGALGIDLDALRKATPTIQGNPSRYRLMFKAPPGVALGRKTLVWPARQPGEKSPTLFELRAGDIQDVLPPTIHPETGRTYTWLVPPNSEFPPLPAALLELWQHWDSYRKELEAMCLWASQTFRPELPPRGFGARPNVIAEFNRVHSVEDLLKEHDYTPKGKRWLSPTSSSGLAGVTILDGRVYSHHASDPLADGHAHDAFDVFRLLDHAGDTPGAIKAAAEALGVRQEPAKGEPNDERRPGNGAGPGANCESRVILVRGDALRVEPIRWQWNGWLARGKLHMLAGAPGAGKSTIALGLAAVVTTGGRWPDGTKCTPGDVLVWSGEDDPADTLLPRLLVAGGDPKRFHIVSSTVDRDGPRQFDPATDIPALLTAAREIPECSLVIVDPVVTVVPGDGHKNVEVRRALQPLVGFASELDAAVFGTSHFTKGTAGRDPVERVTGSVAFGALPRVVMAAARVNEGGAERRIFCRAKSNIGPDSGGWDYQLDLAGVPRAPGVTAVCARWGKVLEGSARDLLAEAEGTIDPEERDKLTEAVDWLAELLKGGPVDSKEIRSDAKQAGVAWMTVERAKVRLGAKAFKATFSGGWRWSLPEHTPPENDTNPLHSANLDGLRKPTLLKPSCGAGSTEGRQPLKEAPPSTPLKPSCGAGSTKGRQASEKNEDLDGLRSNPGVVRVPGVSSPHGVEVVDGLHSNLGVVRVPEDRDAEDRQDRQCVGDGGHVEGDGPAQDPPAGDTEERDRGEV